MMPTQILLNNLLYDVSQVSLSTDSVDEDSILKPPHWNLDFIKRFMYVFGPISSLFDFITFGALYYVFKLAQPAFQAGWFMESMATQILVVYFIRTRKIPFIESSPSLLLLFNTLLVVAAAWIIPFTPLGAIFGFALPGARVVLSIVAIVAVYLFMVEMVKRWFYRREIA
jgi:Mg2+-importing ATPase